MYHYKRGDREKLLKYYGIDVSVGYVSNILRKLEEWGLIRAFRNPINGRLIWVIKDFSKIAEVLVEEMRKQEIKHILKIWGIEQ